MNFDYKKHILCALTSGSHLYGTSTPESDVDIRGVLVPPPQYWYGLESFEQYEPEGEDTVFHELRKFLRLSAAGNPMFLEMWFSPHIPVSTVTATMAWWSVLKLDLWDAVLSKKLIKPHLGMARAHLARIKMPGKRAGLKGLKAIQEFGYNTKDASHVLRVLYQAIELLETGRLTFPSSQWKYLKAIKNGEISLKAIQDAEADLTFRVRGACEKSPLREVPDFYAINKWLIHNVPRMLEDFG